MTRMSMLSQIAACLGIAFLATQPPTLAATPQPPQYPNVIILLGDDVGYGDLACYGGLAPTPNVDRIAKDGLRFMNGYCSSATCTPSRYSLLTGEYAFRQKGTGILPGDANLIIAPGRLTLPALFQRAGYATGAVGKWHLGLGDHLPIDWNKHISPGPNQVGFDYSFIMAATADRVPCVYIENGDVVGLNPDDQIQVDYNTPFPNLPTGRTDRASLKMNWSHTHNDAIVNGVGRLGFMKGGANALWVDEDMSQVFAKHAVQFIEQHANQNKPFFLYYATHNIHVPRVPNHQFVGKTTMGPRGDSIVEFDWQVGQIIETLDRLNLTQNTLLIVTSDNGPVLDDGYVDDANEKLGDHKPAGPLRGGKYSSFEGGTRIPFLVRWPGHVKPATTSSAIVSQVDFAASLAHLIGQKPDPAQSPDSTDLLPTLLGQSPAGRTQVVEHARQLSLRKGDWKYLPPGPVTDHLGPWKRLKVPSPGWLFNLATDPAEEHDLSAQHPDKLKELSQDLTTLRGPSAQPAE